MNLIKSLLVASVLIVITACSSTSETFTSESELPEWVLSPKVEDGLTSTECVGSSGNFSIDRSMATTMARVSIARQIGIKTKLMDKLYNSRTDASSSTSVGNVFSSVSKQISNVSIQGSSVTRSDIVTIDGKQNICVQVSLNPDKTNALIAKLIDESGANLEEQEKSALYQEFKSQGAHKELNEHFDL